ncbi:MAG: helix-turn-helix domain-containing protein, partial [Dehalococcoidia bacterium]
GWSDPAIAKGVEVGEATVERVRKHFVQHGLALALYRRQGERKPTRKFDGEQEAHLIALACSAAPEGPAREPQDWSDPKTVPPAGSARSSDEAANGPERGRPD